MKGQRRLRPSPQDLKVCVDALKWADACVFCFPTWWFGMPAILKGISIAYGARALPLNSRRGGGLIKIEPWFAQF
jgi:NAD(P)H-dependent FMN reductase